MKIILISVIVLVLIATTLAQHNKRPASRRKIPTNIPKKRVQADAPLPSKCTYDNAKIQ